MPLLDTLGHSSWSTLPSYPPPTPSMETQRLRAERGCAQVAEIYVRQRSEGDDDIGSIILCIGSELIGSGIWRESFTDSFELYQSYCPGPVAGSRTPLRT
eukprot:9466950-Pyramimonas_sp.AAC.1